MQHICRKTECVTQAMAQSNSAPTEFPTVRWAWWGNERRWETYSAEHQVRLEQALDSSQRYVRLWHHEIGHTYPTGYEVDLPVMQQARMCYPYTVRAIKRIVERRVPPEQNGMNGYCVRNIDGAIVTEFWQ